jgi:anti-sigma factor RsiW
MRLPTLFNRERRAYEALVSEHLDGALGADARARLDALLAADPARAAEVRELEASTRLLRTLPPARAPRSFALRHAPEPASARPAPADGLLRWAQAATVAASLALVTLIGVDLVGVGTPSTALEATAPVSESFKTAADADDEALAELELLAPAGTPAQEDGAMGIAGLVPEEALTPDTGAVVPIAEPAPETRQRGALEWAQLAAGITTALLALGTVALTATARRLR